MVTVSIPRRLFTAARYWRTRAVGGYGTLVVRAGTRVRPATSTGVELSLAQGGVEAQLKD
jgi:hypothetical protein